MTSDELKDPGRLGQRDLGPGSGVQTPGAQGWCGHGLGSGGHAALSLVELRREVGIGTSNSLLAMAPEQPPPDLSLLLTPCKEHFVPHPRVWGLEEA